ncbi:cadherin-87A-like protein [Dinothrombium tinctorium]|uniref:Cadherin-87A-like protein n=1 Tax=Dinothrombium tinctorium TaxID=1965070 RepID=A0A3S3PN54_9ACAR|nr:cadherin-87A-like protein [Dinothrombium tinctorium]
MPPAFVKNIDLSLIQENTPIGTSAFQLVAKDPEGSELKYGIEGTDLLEVNSRNGKVFVAKNIDRETLGESIRFFVTVEDVVGNGFENNIVRVPVTVLILDENDNAPKFITNDSVYRTEIFENASVNSVVIKHLEARDPDIVGSILSVFCDGCNEKFKVKTLGESSTNFIRFSLLLAKELEYRPNFNKHKIILKVFDGIRNSSLNAEITVKDVQNKPPVFIGSTTAIISEDLPVGSLVLKVRAIDGDVISVDAFMQDSSKTRFGREIRYNLFSNPGSYFSLDSKSGDLKVASRLDKEAFPSTNGVITLKVRAFEVENGLEPFEKTDGLSSTVTSITITLQDVNDETPMFNKHEYHVSIPEGVPNGTPLASLDMLVEDKDTGSNGVFNIALIDPSGIFSVEPPIATGSTSVSIKVSNGPLDYENPNQQKFILLVVATEAFTKEKFSSTATVTVSIEDVNDNPPKFDSDLYSASVLEDAVPGTIVKAIRATDRDSLSITALVYSLFGNGAELFNVNPLTGVITVADCMTPGSGNCIDFETRSNYYLSYQASDSFGQSTVVPLSIHILDANDNAPQFLREKFTAIIDEGSIKFEPMLKVRANDADITSVITYSIIGGNQEHLFSIEPRSGEIKVLHPVKSKYSKIILKVQAHDGGKGVAVCDVEITIRDANDNAPIFEKSFYTASISEASKPGTFVEKVTAFDADSGINAEVIYKIQRGAFDEFVIEEETGIVKVADRGHSLDFDRRRVYDVEIYAIDKGVPSKTGTTTLTITIINHNDKAPHFTPTTQRTQVNENDAIGHKVYRLIATDPDTDFAQSLYYKTESLSAIDKNGLKVDKDSSAFKEIQRFFSVESSGDVLIASKINRDLAAVVILNVSATDISSPTDSIQVGYGSLIITIVDYNDHPPVFGRPWTPQRPEMSYSIQEEQPIGTVLVNLLATDIDSKIDHYTIEPPNEYFDIDRDSGVITIRKVIDFEKIATDAEQDSQVQIRFNVMAYDSGVPQLSAKAVIIVNVININDNEPIFTQNYYNATVAENARPDTVVVVVNATDADKGKFGKIKYSIISESGNSDNGLQTENFVINEDTGVLSVAHGAQLDREKGPILLTLQVAATDNPEASSKNDNDTNPSGGSSQPRLLSVPVYITIADVNDNSPIFAQREYETSTLGHSDGSSTKIPVIQVSASDADEGINGQVLYKIISGNSLDIFEIDENSGVIYAIKSPLLHNENIKEYKLKIEARDQMGKGPFFDETIVRIKIVEINRHKPKFIKPTVSEIKFMENQQPGAVVLSVEGYDEDNGNNGVIKYSFKIDASNNAQETKQFRIDSETGVISSKVSFDREEEERYELVLSIRDYLGEPQTFETLQKLTVIIDDADDNKPVFERHANSEVTYSFSVLESESRGIIVGQVTAIDIDSKPEYRQIYYTLVDGNPNHEFHINANDGIIYSNISFDRELKSEYLLTVKASSNPNFVNYVVKGRESLKEGTLDAEDLSLAVVRVVILDINDNPPVFTKQIYRSGITYKADIGQTVMVVKANDADSDFNSLVSYTISSIDLYRKGYDSPDSPVRPIPSPFTIGADGRIVTTQLMAEYPIGSRFVLNLEAREQEPPHRISQARCYIWVYDPMKLIRVSIKLKPEIVHSRKEEIESILSNASDSRAIVNEIKYHYDFTRRKLNKDWSDAFVLFVDDKTYTDLSPNRVISRLDSNGLLHAEQQLEIEKIALASDVSIASINEIDVPTIVLFVLVVLITFGFIAMCVCCCCLKSWYNQKLIEKAVKAAKSARMNAAKEREMLNSIREGYSQLVPINGTNIGRKKSSKLSSADKRQQVPKQQKENPLWTETSAKFYEEQELSMRMTTSRNSNDQQAQTVPSTVPLETESNHYATLKSRTRQRKPERKPRAVDNVANNHEYHELKETVEKSKSNTDQGNLQQMKTMANLETNSEGEPELIGALL